MIIVAGFASLAKIGSEALTQSSMNGSPEPRLPLFCKFAVRCVGLDGVAHSRVVEFGVVALVPELR